MDEVEQGQIIQAMAPNGIVRLIAHSQQLDFFARFLGTEDDETGAYLVFQPDEDRDYKIRVASKAPTDVATADGMMFYGTEDKWRIRAATPDESAQFEMMMGEG